MGINTKPMPKIRIFWTKWSRFWTKVRQFICEVKNKTKKRKMVEFSWLQRLTVVFCIGK